MARLARALRDSHHASHYGSVLLLGWAIAALSAYPSVLYPKQIIGELSGGLTVAAPLIAHLYSLRALLALRQERRVQANMLAAWWTLSYLPVGLLAALILPWPQAYALPFSGAVLALMSFGLLLPGLSPFIAYGLNAKWVRPHESPWRLGAALLLFVIGWALAAIVAEVFSSI